MEHNTTFSLLSGQTNPFRESDRRPRIAADTRRREVSSDDDQHVGDVPVAIVVDEPLPRLNPREHTYSSARHAKTGEAARPVLIPPPPGVGSSAAVAASPPMEVDDGTDAASASPQTQQLTATERTAALRQTSSPVDVPPSAVPASRYRNLYDGSVYLPPGTTKRALGRMRLLWGCVLTEESFHASFIAGPIIFFTIIFVVFVVPPGEWFSYLFTLVFTIGSLTCLTLSVTLDPGIIPPAPLSEMPRGPVKMMVDGRMVECKICKTCHIVRPPRSSHCKFCDVCVDEFDHHCGILGSCVAKRTFRFFGGFFILTTFLALYVLIRSFVIVVRTDFRSGNEDMHVLAVAAGSVVCIFAAIIGGIMVVPCAARYIMLSATNETTKESMRREEQQEQHPQQRADQIPGCVPVEEMRSDNYCLNFVRRFFAPLGRSRIPFDYYV